MPAGSTQAALTSGQSLSASRATRKVAAAPELGPQPGEPWPCQRLDLFLIWRGKFLNLSCGMAFAPCRKRARGPGGSNWFQSRTSCWNPAALIREVHFQVAVSNWYLTPTQGCHRCPPNLNCCTYWSRARNQAKAGRGARNNSFHLLSTYLVCICCWVRCFVNIISHFYNLVAIPSVSDLRMKKKEIQRI